MDELCLANRNQDGKSRSYVEFLLRIEEERGMDWWMCEQEMMGEKGQGLGPSMVEVPPLWWKILHFMEPEGTGRNLLKMRRGRGKGNGRKEKEDKIVEKVDRMLDCNNIGQGLGRTGKTQHVSQETFSQSFTPMHVCSV